ncbi:MAG: hypothetical protein DDT19_02322 [Syntrophomonadaceae bacterium]|nr:hypothetical protein [Bacillota bacterium]
MLHKKSCAVSAPLEKTITAAVLRWLRAQPGCYAIKTHGDYRQAGQPDIIGSYRGKCFALEVKRPGGKVTPLQTAILVKWGEAGAVAGVVTSVEDVKKIWAEVEIVP